MINKKEARASKERGNSMRSSKILAVLSAAAIMTAATGCANSEIHAAQITEQNERSGGRL